MTVARTIALGDLHLSRATPKPVGEAFARLLDAHAGTRVIVAGDLFDFSADHPTSDLRASLGAHPSARAALARHLDRPHAGGALWLASGNHDADVGTGGFADRLVRALDLDPSRAENVRTTPWFFREGNLHVEHGHVFDPDNAPSHPLAEDGSTRPSLGVRFVRDFIAPTGAHAYLNRNDKKPLELFLSSFKLYGARAPYVIYKYFDTAFRCLAGSGPMWARELREIQEEKVASFAHAAGLDERTVRDIAATRPEPTLASFRQTFARLYLDRVAATVAIAGGGVAAALGYRSAGAWAVGLGVVGLAVSWGLGHDRYSGAVVERLADGARDVRTSSGASLVIFGHTHREAEAEGYANTGSFAFPAGDHGRPFLEIEGTTAQPRAARRHWK
jgi:UDP-2,3-diacylglucosamine pyrophosphatase LpxH